jgi:hypothetical protein
MAGLGSPCGQLSSRHRKSRADDMEHAINVPRIDLEFSMSEQQDEIELILRQIYPQKCAIVGPTMVRHLIAGTATQLVMPRKVQYLILQPELAFLGIIVGLIANSIAIARVYFGSPLKRTKDDTKELHEKIENHIRASQIGISIPPEQIEKMEKMIIEIVFKNEK